MTTPLTAHRRAQAMIAEGCCLLGRLTIYTIELLCLRLIALDRVQPIRHVLVLTAVTAMDLLLLSPLYLSREAWYSAAVTGAPPLKTLLTGWHHYFRAVSWRFQLWRRRITALLLGMLPAVALLSYGEYLRRIEAPAATVALWLPLGMAALLLGVGAAAWWQCRYAAAPLLILEGYPAIAAMQLSALAMRRQKRSYVNTLGAHLWRPLVSMAMLPAPWVLPPYRLCRVAMLRRAIAAAPIPR